MAVESESSARRWDAVALAAGRPAVASTCRAELVRLLAHPLAAGRPEGQLVTTKPEEQR